MTRPVWEVADVIHSGGSRFLDRYRKSLTWPQVKVLNAITRCRTAALGGHSDQCDRCGHQTMSYNPAETGIARSAKPMHVMYGFDHGNKSFYRSLTITSSSVFRTGSSHWFGRTSDCCSLSCSTLVS